MKPYNKPGDIDPSLSEISIDTFFYILNNFLLFYVITESGEILPKTRENNQKGVHPVPNDYYASHLL